ncbi:MAG: hypothetical protein JKP98_05865 [Rhodobacteraceae bacterium]|nr:hypothetical protein [Paracoccaceae bacterium]
MTRWEYRTPGTALWWSDVAGWCAAARRLLGPALFGRRSAALEAHAAALPLSMIAAETDAAAIADALDLLKHGRPALRAAARSARHMPRRRRASSRLRTVQHGLPAMPTRFRGRQLDCRSRPWQPPAVIRSPCPTGGKCQPWVDTFTGCCHTVPRCLYPWARPAGSRPGAFSRLRAVLRSFSAPFA